MKLHRSALLHFYDDPTSAHFSPEGRGAHVSAITGLMGEDLVLALLIHYWCGKGSRAEVLSYKCTTGKSKGSRLDAWVLKDDKELFQVEVKNWSGHSLGGYTLPENCPEEQLAAFANKRWMKYFAGDESLPDEISKILDNMRPPSEFEKLPVAKLIGFWFPIWNSDGQPFSVKVLKTDVVNVFSASAYLRALPADLTTLELALPRAEARLALIAQLRGDIFP